MEGKWENDGARLLARLERHWQARYTPRQLRRHLLVALGTLREALARDTGDARLVLETYRQLLHRRATAQAVEEANEALRRLLKDLGLAILALLPLSFITLPALFALAHRLGMDLVPPETPAGTDRAKSK